MIKVKLTTQTPEWPLLRQTPGSRGIWGDCQFFLNEDIDECDYWVVCEGLLRPEKTVCPPGNTILITGEPPSVKTYNYDYVNQFATVITSHREIKHPNVIYTQQALPWMVGGRYIKESKTWETPFTKDYDELSTSMEYRKDRLISIILSKKTFTQGHSKRLEFVNKLKRHFGDDLDIFGVGINEIVDKWDGIARYKYYLAIENCCCQDYWTEKLSDAYLAGAYPFYYGCPNINKYFSENAFTHIDIDDIDKSIRIIEDEVHNQRYEKDIDEIHKAKDLILNKYNLFPMLVELCNKSSNNNKDSVIFKPEPKSYLRRKLDKVKSLFNSY